MILTCLSVRQPMADQLLCVGNPAVDPAHWKWVENRDTLRLSNLIGQRLGIHASAAKPHPDDPAPPISGTRGAILGTAELVASVQYRDLRDVMYLDRTAKGERRDRADKLARLICEATGIRRRDLLDHPSWEHVVGPNCLIFARPEVFPEPIPAKGALGPWRFDLETVTA